MENKIVSFETAKLAKEVGYDGVTWASYSDTGELDEEREDIQDGSCYLIDYNNPDSLDIRGERFCAPTQTSLQTWLRETHGIIVEPTFEFEPNTGKDYYLVIKNKKTKESVSYKYYPEFWFEKYEDCLEVGLFEALTKMKNGK